nr:transposase [Actinomycetota bacterium]
CMVDLSRDANGQIRARLLDLVLGRSGPSYGAWITAQPPEFQAGIKHAALDPFRGYANALRDHLSDAVQVLDAFHVVKVRHEAPCVPSGGERPPPPGCHSSPVKLRAA